MYDVWIFNILLRFPFHVGLWWCRVIHSSPVNMIFFLSHFHVIISAALGEVKRDIIWKIKDNFINMCCLTIQCKAL